MRLTLSLPVGIVSSILISCWLRVPLWTRRLAGLTGLIHLLLLMLRIRLWAGRLGVLVVLVGLLRLRLRLLLSVPRSLGVAGGLRSVLVVLLLLLGLRRRRVSGSGRRLLLVALSLLVVTCDRRSPTLSDLQGLLVRELLLAVLLLPVAGRRRLGLVGRGRSLSLLGLARVCTRRCRSRGRMMTIVVLLSGAGVVCGCCPL